MVVSFLDLDSMTWTCMVCHDERPDARISVRHRMIPGLESGFPESRVNLRYCNDRLACTTVACERGVWPRPHLVLQDDDVLELTPQALAERPWTDRSRSLKPTAVGILTWLRDEQAPISALLAAYDEPAQTVFDTARSLIDMGLVRFADGRSATRAAADPARGRRQL